MKEEIKIPRRLAIFMLKWGVLNKRRAQIFCQEYGGCVSCDEGLTHSSCDFVSLAPEEWLSVEADKNLKTFKMIVGHRVKRIEPEG